MNINETYGKELPLWQLLSCREERVSHQQALFDKYSLPIICFTLNIAGPVKRYSLADEAFDIGFEHILSVISNKGFHIRHSEKVDRLSGCEGYMVIDAAPLEIKKIAAEIEEENPSFRLFDIDVIRVNGEKVSRSEIGKGDRHCLVCDEQASVCARSRAHGLDVIIEKTYQLLRDMVYNYRSHILADKAVKALLDEVYTTPKPGLVDRNNNGSHSDMDVPLFEKSAFALRGYFHDISLMGQNADICHGALSSLRELGKQAEKQMFETTNGINTHKGAVFSMGIMCFCAGYILGQGIKITADLLHQVCKDVCCDVLDDFNEINGKENHTAGEDLYITNHIAGIRGEAHNGFPAVFYLALPFYEDIQRNGFSENDAGCIVLLQLIAQLEDTNVLKRGGMDGLMRCMTRAKRLLSVRLPLDELMDEIKRFDDEMINLNLSPGGCADLLALTYFVHSIIE